MSSSLSPGVLLEGIDPAWDGHDAEYVGQVHGTRELFRIYSSLSAGAAGGGAGGAAFSSLSYVGSR